MQSENRKAAIPGLLFERARVRNGKDMQRKRIERCKSHKDARTIVHPFKTQENVTSSAFSPPSFLNFVTTGIGQWLGAN